MKTIIILLPFSQQMRSQLRTMIPPKMDGRVEVPAPASGVAPHHQLVLKIQDHQYGLHGELPLLVDYMVSGKGVGNAAQPEWEGVTT